MNILVTGGSGNVGRTVVATLLEAGHTLTVFDAKAPVSGRVRFVEGSVTDPAAVFGAAKDIDAIVHLAAIPAYRKEIPSVDFMHVNVTGTFNVLEAAGAQGVAKVVLASSDSSLGFVFSTHAFSPECFPIDENHPLKPQDPYGLSKQLGEALCASASRKYGIETVCLRFCWVWFEDTYAHRPGLNAGDQQGLAKTMWGYVDVRDAAQACRLAVERPIAGSGSHDVFFITAADTFADTPSIELIRRYYPDVARIGDEFLSDPFVSLFDIRKARKRLGYAPAFGCRQS